MLSLSHGAAWLLWFLTLPAATNAPVVPIEKPNSVMEPRVFLGLSEVEGRPGVYETTKQTQRQPQARNRGLFVSWGYNGDSFTKSDMHFSQPSLGNNFTLAGVEARDSKAWTSLFNHGLFVPQYNVRIGYFFNDKWGFEVALDHIKWIVRQDQQVRITGTLNNAPVDSEITLTPEVLRYQLNNGANPIFFNLIRRVHLAGEPGRPGHVSFLAKAGGGFAVPHTENRLFDQPNDDGFQFFKGWDLDAGVAVRIHLFKPLYFEFEEKVVYARYFGVKIAQGTARHSMKANEFAFHFGLAFNR